MNSYLLLFPDELPAEAGGVATFTCFFVPSSQNIISDMRWIIDGLLLESDSLENVTPQFADGLGTLTFRDVSVSRNKSTIQCRAEVLGQDSEATFITSNNATLFVHEGELDQSCSHTGNCTCRPCTWSFRLQDYMCLWLRY